MKLLERYKHYRVVRTDVSLRRPPLYEQHDESGADFTDFGGWEMPVSFGSIQDEHAAVRQSVGLFDVSHMGLLSITGADAATLLQRLLPSDVRELESGRAAYSCFLRRDGVILDDVVVYDHPTADEYLVVPNAGHDEEIWARLHEHASRWDVDVTIDNRTEETGILAVQGPDSVADLDPFEVREATIDGVECLIARTGYTGEDGFEIVFSAAESDRMQAAFDGVQPCGLGARDTLRIEAGLLLSGQDFDPVEEPHDPYEAGIGFVVDEDAGDFVGREALNHSVDERLVGLRLEERGIARHGYEILHDGERVGRVTSGSMSPTLGVPIALGYIDASLADEGTELNVSIRGRTVSATVVGTRFLESCRTN